MLGPSAGSPALRPRPARFLGLALSALLAACAAPPGPLVTPAPAPPARSASPVGGSFGLAGPRPTTAPTATPTLGLPRPTPTTVSTPATPTSPRTPTPPLAARAMPGPSERTTPTPGLARPSLPTLPSLPTVPRLSPPERTPPAAPSRAVAPSGRTTCPDTHPIKGVITPTDRVYLTRTSPAYPSAEPTQCFATEADARLAGFVLARRLPTS